MQRNRTGSAGAGSDILTVTQLNRRARRLLEDGLPGLRVEGELSNVARPASGHLYFSLKDDQAQVRCAMFRSANRGLNFKPEAGTHVLVSARVSIYEPRGDYQLIVEHMEEAGEGLLRRRFEALKAQLAAEGLFAAEHKQPLPDLPGTIGIVTSPSGAAVRDILNVLRRRYPAAGVIVYPTRVQGDGAAAEIARAIDTAATRNEVDVLIVARGGGSLEDLWAFNEEAVARAIYRCTLPVVAGVGHEVDVTIADLVADLRAPTPSGAAELVTPDRATLLRQIDDRLRRGGLSVQRALQLRHHRHRELAARLHRLRPEAVVEQLSQRTDELTRQLVRLTRQRLARESERAGSLGQRLYRASPRAAIVALVRDIGHAHQQLARVMSARLAATGRRLAVAAGSLQAVSPLATLERGYAIVRDPQQQVVTDASRLNAGDEITGQLAKGSFDAVISRVRRD